MPHLILYLGQCSLSLSFAWLFYRLALRPLTFHRLNRWFLASACILSFWLPLIDIGPWVEKAPVARQPAILRILPPISDLPITTPAQKPATSSVTQTTPVNPWAIAVWAIIAISFLLLIRTLLRARSLVRIRRQSTLVHSVGFSVYHLPREMMPFSFGNAVYLYPPLHTPEEYRDIVRHEYVHIRQLHTIDILLAEAIVIAGWYNPFAWGMRRAIRQNLEFIADKEMLTGGRDKKEYQYHLLTVMGSPVSRLTSPFGFSFIKSRIVMMNRRPSPRPQLLKLIALGPLLLLLLLSFRHHPFRYPSFPKTTWPQQHHNTTGHSLINVAGIVLDQRTFQPLGGVVVSVQNTHLQRTTDANGFYTLQVPLTGEQPRLEFEFDKKGYTHNTSGGPLMFPDTVEGRIPITVLSAEGAAFEGAYMQDPAYPSPPNPSYEDARQMMEKVVQDDLATHRFYLMQKAHPEISLFYAQGDLQRRWVFYRDGRVETYGGPGNPSFAVMDARYSPMPWYMARNRSVNYPENENPWQVVANRLQKEFHPRQGDAKAIVFTAEGRIIVIPATGEAEFYYMLNSDRLPNGRSGFEARYGKLPDYVPYTVQVPGKDYKRIIFPLSPNQ